MDPQRVWSEFRQKLADGALETADCVPHSPMEYAAFFRSEKGQPLARFIARQTEPRIEWAEDKLVFTVRSDERNEFRLDFELGDGGWRFYLVDGLTLPFRRVPDLPLSTFAPHESENRMRTEDVVTRRVYLYLKLRDRLGKEEALSWFRDGPGFRHNVEAWPPYLTLRKASVLFAAWRENRYWGQDMVVEELSEERARLRFREPEEMLLCDLCGHLRPRISREEYREVFEDAWRDRARAAGWRLEVQYEERDTLFRLEREED